MQQPEIENPSKKNKAKRWTSQQVDAVEPQACYPEKVTNHTESVTVEESIKHKKKKKKKRIGNDPSVNDGVEEAPSSAKSVDKKRKKRNREKEVAAARESATGEMSEAGKGGDSDDPTTSKQMSEKKRRKGKDVVSGGLGHLEGNATAEMGGGGGGKEGEADVSLTSKPNQKIPSSSKPRRRVGFSAEVEVFDDKGKSFTPQINDDALVRGKRCTPEEDDLIKEAVMKYIKGNQLGKEGLQMVLNNQKLPHLRGCWKAIGASLPWRPVTYVYARAHTLFERCESSKWEPHEYETLMRLHEQYGPQWKIIGAELGKHRFVVKHAWGRISLANRKYGKWSQEEYQSLFDLVNLDLAMKAFVEKKTKCGMLRDNIYWEAISMKLSTRMHTDCCLKWYKQLSSPLVSQGLWFDTDDYRLLDVLQKLDACCVEDVDWDNLIENRPGDICRKRWDQMVRHIGGHREKSFIEQLDVLSKRYCPEMLQYRKDEGCSNATPLASGTSPHQETLPK